MTDYAAEPASRTTPLPTQTLLIGVESSGKRIGSIDYTPAEPGETIELGPPLWAPGTEATVVGSRTVDGDDGKLLHVLEVTRLRMLGNDVGQSQAPAARYARRPAGALARWQECNDPARRR